MDDLVQLPQSPPVEPDQRLPTVQTVIDALPYLTVVLDTRGVVSAVNRAWVASCHENAASHAVSTGLGLNYVDICEAASAADSPDALRALDAIRAVSTGSLKHASFQYPCEINGIKRQFLFAAQRFCHMDSGVVVSHVEITELLAHQQFLTASHERDRFAADLHDGLCQELIGISFMLKAASRRAAQAGTTHVTELARIGRLIDRSSSHAREIARAVAPVKFGAADPKAAVRRHVDTIYASKNGQISVKFTELREFVHRRALASVP